VGDRVSGIWGANVIVCETPAEAARAGAARVTTWLSAAVSARKRATVALAGGRTPEALYRLLAEIPYRERIDWDRVEIFWGDERCVPPDHPDSNYRMVREALLAHVPIPDANIHRMRGELADPVASAHEYEEVLRQACRVEVDTLPRLDVCLLGLGSDGHTASLFPGSPAIREQQRWVMAGWVEKLGAWRLTLAPRVINNARHVLFLATGAEKAETVGVVLEGPVVPDRLPAQIVRPAYGQLEWLLDRDAAGRLGPHLLHRQPPTLSQ
jgi:6-phosphogluconolactonase